MKYLIILIFFITSASFGMETLPIKPFGISFQEMFKNYNSTFCNYSSSILSNIYKEEFSDVNGSVELKHKIVLRAHNLSSIAKESRFFSGSGAYIEGIVSESREHNVGIIAYVNKIDEQEYNALLLILKNKYGKPNFGKTGWLAKDSISGEEICINLTEDNRWGNKTIISYIIKNDYLLEQLILETQKLRMQF